MKEVKFSEEEGKRPLSLKELLSEFLSQQGYEVYPGGRFRPFGPLGKRKPDIVVYKPGIGSFLIEISHCRHGLIPDQ